MSEGRSARLAARADRTRRNAPKVALAQGRRDWSEGLLGIGAAEHLEDALPRRFDDGQTVHGQPIGEPTVTKGLHPVPPGGRAPRGRPRF